MCLCTKASPQFKVTLHREGYDKIPPEVQKNGFWFQKSVLVNMDNDNIPDDVMLFGRDLGHYPTFDLFEVYYAIVDSYTLEVKYLSTDTYITDSMDLIVEDRNNDGKYELYQKYFKDKSYSTDSRGYNLKVSRCYDRIEWITDSEIIKKKHK